MAFAVQRGTNISHWLSQSERRGEERSSFFVRADVERIAGWGFDHIRLPVDEVQIWDEGRSLNQEAADLLRAAIDWAVGADLRVIVDLHILRGHYFNDDEVPALFTDPSALGRFVQLWIDLSNLLSDYANDAVAYELLNEAVAPTPEQWNQTWRAPFAAVREREPERTIVLGSNRFNQFQTYPDLAVPEDDNLILTFHYYNPMFITHYTARWWDGGSYTGPIRYPGAPIPDSQHIALDRLKAEGQEWENRRFDREVMVADMSIPAGIASEHGYPLYCGEFGCYEHTPEDIRQAWYRDIISSFDALGIAWANWDYKGSFGLVDVHGNETGVRDWLMG